MTKVDMQSIDAHNSDVARLYPNGRSLINLDDGAILSLRAIQPSDKSALSKGFRRLSTDQFPVR